MRAEIVGAKRLTANRPSKKKAGGRSKRRPLRKEKLVKAVRLEMERLVNLSPKNRENRINVSNLARRLKISRTSIYDNGLGQEVEDFAALQLSNDKVNTEAAVLRRPLEERIKSLEKTIEELWEKLDGWIQRWAEVEYNAKLYGYDPDRLFAPIPPPIRKTIGSGRGRKKKR